MGMLDTCAARAAAAAMARQQWAELPTVNVRKGSRSSLLNRLLRPLLESSKW
jgi:hypothetical protein